MPRAEPQGNDKDKHKEQFSNSQGHTMKTKGSEAEYNYFKIWQPEITTIPHKALKCFFLLLLLLVFAFQAAELYELFVYFGK